MNEIKLETEPSAALLDIMDSLPKKEQQRDDDERARLISDLSSKIDGMTEEQFNLFVQLCIEALRKTMSGSG